VPFLSGNLISGTVVVLAVYALLVHYFSFGENSLMDYAMGYDKNDPNKQHHPLNSGEISLQSAHFVIHWGLTLLSAIGVLITILVSPNIPMALGALVVCIASGHAYNEGLSKESLFGFVSISLCFTFLAAWAWFLGHSELTPISQIYLVYVFLVILFQISWSGHLKELGQSERSNILIKMGARLRDGQFEPGLSDWYGLAVKIAGIYMLFEIARARSAFTVDRLAWLVSLVVLMMFFLSLLTRTRPYNRPMELQKMSIMEILSIYAPIPLMLPWSYALVLMAAGIVYFFGVNRWLWGVSYPRV
jgi:4-hydroxybenzoate polyprenyltransferase